MKKIQLRISLYTRFMGGVAVLLVLLVVSILFVIEKREVQTITDESRNRGILIARNFVILHQQQFVFWDLDPIQRNIEDQISDELIYVVFYERNGTPQVANDFIQKYESIYCCSRLAGEITPESFFTEPRILRTGGRVLRILEIELPIFAESLPADSVRGPGLPSRWGSVKIGLSLEDMHAAINQTRKMLILIGGVGFFLGMIGTVFLARRITKPLKKLVDGTVRISRGEFTHQIEIDSGDEVGDLARSFNEMSRDLLRTRERMEEANRRLIQAEKLASIGRLSATIAHEIRNPLTSVKLNIQKVAQNEHLDEIEKEHLSISQEGISQIEKFIMELLDFTRVADLNVERFSIVQVLEESLKMMAGCFMQKGIIVDKKFDDRLPQVPVDGDRMRQVFLNVLRNACEAVGQGGRISISLAPVQKEDGRKVRIKIADNGCGIPEKDWETIFEPFFTTKPSGFGLGLSNARKIVEQHQGLIRVVKKRGRGTAFEVLIPCEGAE